MGILGLVGYLVFGASYLGASGLLVLGTLAPVPAGHAALR